MNLYSLAFYFLAFITIASAVVVIFSRNLVYAAYSLMFTLLSISGLYVLLTADFIAIVQIMVYVGGILILLLFGIMLTQEQTRVKVKVNYLYIGITMLVIGLLGAVLYNYIPFVTNDFSNINYKNIPNAVVPGTSTIKQIGSSLLNQYVLIFEVLGMLLLIVLVAATTIGRKEK
ncbi:MAG TPA: NADH-quinone oxidoreductase subunit J [Ignavibacteriales bacterium]|nr:NADH-quinone oxidoreductase subunit J [Ignavibacteriales bacterium]HOL82308.1 NADH-quinone oxidoreductase subunit J [Ignavibacteriales bacterium]HPP34521.1 NADH-quinone oxidoreductase subunit J [Ignavibacteriales bacterium]